MTQRSMRGTVRHDLRSWTGSWTTWPPGGADRQGGDPPATASSLAPPAAGQEDAEHLAAVAAGFQSPPRGAGAGSSAAARSGRSSWVAPLVLFVTAGGRQLPGVLSRAADAGLIAYEMAGTGQAGGTASVHQPRPVIVAETPG
jgi:hypothetical protein